MTDPCTPGPINAAGAISAGIMLAACFGAGWLVDLRDGSDNLLITDRGQLVNAPAGALARTTRLDPSEYPDPGELLREIAAVVKLARSDQWHAQPQPEID